MNRVFFHCLLTAWYSLAYRLPGFAARHILRVAFLPILFPIYLLPAQNCSQYETQIAASEIQLNQFALPNGGLQVHIQIAEPHICGVTLDFALRFNGTQAIPRITSVQFPFQELGRCEAVISDGSHFSVEVIFSACQSAGNEHFELDFLLQFETTTFPEHCLMECVGGSMVMIENLD